MNVWPAIAVDDTICRLCHGIHVASVIVRSFNIHGKVSQKSFMMDKEGK
jgi:hypothetical protein